MTMKIQNMMVAGSLYNGIIFDNTVHSSFRGSYGVVRYNNEFLPISNKSGDWKFLTRSANKSCVYYAGATNSGRYRYQNTVCLSQNQLSALWAKVQATKTITAPTAFVAKDPVSSRTLHADAVVYNQVIGKSQFFKNGTSMIEMVKLLVERGFPENETTILMYISNKSLHPVWKEKVVKTSVFAL